MDRERAAQLKDALKAFARRIGVTRLGVTDARPFDRVREVLRQRREAGLTSPFEEKDIDLRCDPQRLLPGAAALISIAVSYHVRAPFAKPRSGTGRHRGWISRHAWGRDYHRIVGDKLARIAAWLTEQCPGSETKAFVDTGPPVDRAVAERAGVGWIGKNCSLIVPGAGSWVVLGTLVTTVPLPPDPPAAPPGTECADCDLCLRACPTQALFAPHRLDPYRCLSYVTQMRGPVPHQFRPALGKRIYGCDTCQQVCPKNRDLLELGDAGFVPASEWETAPDLLGLLELSKRQFRERYGDKASGWRGKTTLQRNAIIALGNARDPQAVPRLTRLLLDDVRPVIRGAAAWALGRIGGTDAEAALHEARQREPDAYVREEIEQALAAAKGGAVRENGWPAREIGQRA